MKIQKYKILFVVGDILLILLSIFIAGSIVKVIRPNYFAQFNISPHLNIFFVFLIILLHIFIFQINNLYKINVILLNLFHAIAVVKAVLFSLTVTIFIAYFLKFTFIIDSRLFILFYFVALILTLMLLRIFLFKKIYLILTDNKLVNSKALIYGCGYAGKSVGAKILVEKIYPVDIVGYIDDKVPVGTEVFPHKKVICDLDNLETYLNNNGQIDEAIIAIDNITYERLVDIIQVLQFLGLRVRVTSELFSIVPLKMEIEKFGDIPVVNISPQVHGIFNLWLKRVFDIIGSFLGLIFLSPVFIVLAFLIKITSKGPVIFLQVRIGKNGKVFNFYKFRSMYLSNQEDDERKKMMIEFIENGKTQESNHSKIINNSRVTWIGKIIRRTSLDELPQLVNVLMGEMSLVGPRPCLPYEYENYDTWQKQRLNVLPGCTGVWQVWGRSSVSFKDSIVLDLYYVNNMSPWLDLLIMLKTIPVMLFGRGGK
ncbi:MAG: sugar transferase [Melioribacteraceae bacterium]